MDLDGLDDALGAWALGALTEEETAAVDAALDRDAAAAKAGTPLQGVVATLAEPLSAAPPDGLRVRVLAAAGVAAAGRPPVEPPVTPLDAYSAQVDRLRALLVAVEPDRWSAPVEAYGWPLHRLAVHLVGVERYFLDVLTTPELRSRQPAPDHLALGADRHGAEPTALVDEWSAVAGRAVHHLGSLPEVAMEQAVVFHGLPMSLAGLLVLRAFELWTHGDDVRRALGQPVEQPLPGELRTMADRAVRGLPSLMLLAGIEPPAVPIRVVLTGPGGGTWDVDLDVDADPAVHATGPPRTTLVADVVDFCRLVSRRLPLAALDHHVEGDAALGRDLLEAAQAIAV
jgi:uncharacterized protein (TIGR03083 family)